MTEPFVAGTFTSEPVRVHVYANVGKLMLVNADNQGCWSDPSGRVMLPTMDIVDRILAAHGYERDPQEERMVRKRAQVEAPEPVAPEPGAPEDSDTPEGADSQAGSESSDDDDEFDQAMRGVMDVPEPIATPAPEPTSAPEPVATPAPEPTSAPEPVAPVSRRRRR